MSNDVETIKEYRVGNYTLTWVFNENEADASKLPENNLCIDDIWNIKDSSPNDNCCVHCRVIDEVTFAYTTFGGMYYVMSLKNGVVEKISSRLVK